LWHAPIQGQPAIGANDVYTKRFSHHFTAANFDSVEFIKERHADITHLHLKDRKRNGGPNVEWGQGDAPIKQVLQLLKTAKYPIPAHVEYEYPGKSGCVEEVQKCVEFAKRALA
jgi:sugar phosphate isomerase/epimerase